jgi:hypothetical protein
MMGEKRCIAGKPPEDAARDASVLYSNALVRPKGRH